MSDATWSSTRPTLAARRGAARWTSRSSRSRHPRERRDRQGVRGWSLVASRRRMGLRFLASPAGSPAPSGSRGCGSYATNWISRRHGAIRAEHDRPRAKPSTAVWCCARSATRRGRRGRAVGRAFRAVDPQRARARAGRARWPRATRRVSPRGWIKRGPTGVIGTNKKCAHETVDNLLEDLAAGRLPEPQYPAQHVDGLLAERTPQRVDYAGWQRIDAHERVAGEAQGRPRVKLTSRDELLAYGLPTPRAT